MNEMAKKEKQTYPRTRKEMLRIMRSAVWTVRSVDEVFFASDTIIGIKKEKTNKNNTIKPVKTT